MGELRSKAHVTVERARRLTGTAGARLWRWVLRAKWGMAGAASRITAAVMAVAGMVLIAVSFAAPQAAFANAANPAPDTIATPVVNNNGTVTINLSGTWTWPNQACAGRYGEGWAVDWWGASTSPSAPNFSVDATQLTGIAQSDVTVAPEAATGSLAIPSTSDYFHFGPLYNGEDVNTASTCTDTGSGNSATSSGAWNASGTYPSASDVPPQLCVIMYDEHGTEGSPRGSSTADSNFNTTDHDNSIQTNAFNPLQGQGYCFSSNFSPDVSVKKTGPASASPGGTGTYTLTVSNAGVVAAKNVAVTDTLPTGETYVSSVDSNTSSGTCSLGGTAVSGTSPGAAQTITCMVDSLAAEADSQPGTATISVTVSYAADATGSLTDCATVLNQATPSCVTTVIVPVVPPTQNLVGKILLCDSDGNPTSTPEPGTISGTGPSSVTTATLPPALNQTVGTAGDYTLDATVTSAFSFVACGTTGTTIGTPATTANQSVNVPAGGTGTGTFYVVPVGPVTQTIIGHIYLCDGTTQTITEVTGGTLATTNSPDDIVATPNPLSQLVPAGTYTLDATSPADYHFTDCSPTSTGTPTTATQTVIVPTGGTGTGIFYVAPNITLTVAKANNAAGTGFAQTETATKAGEDVPFQVVITNPSTTTPVTITAITDAWPGNGPFSNVCSNAVIGKTLQPGASATCDFTVTNYAPAAGSSVTNTAEVTGCQSATSPDCTTVPATSTVTTPAATAAVTSAPTTPVAPARVPVVSHPTGALAFTGVPTHLQLLLEIGLGMLSVGMFILWFTRPRTIRA
jgi:uncharacterized repeat protein (TIGR01451 family)